MNDSANVERLMGIKRFLDKAGDDPEVNSVSMFLEESKCSLPLILCDSEERIAKPNPAQEAKATSYQEAAILFVMWARFFPGLGGGVVILDSSRNKVFSR
ncbi:MAG: hypothetical protein V1487_00070 [bacterium]